MATTKQKLPLVAEAGSTGLKRTGGYVSADFLPRLQGIEGAKAFGEMSLNDPMIGAMLYAIVSLIKNVDWRIESADHDKASVDAKEVLERVLFKELHSSFEDVVEEACEQFTYGFAPMETVWRKDEESGWLVPKKLAIRHPETISRWEFDAATGETLGFWQWDPSRSGQGEVFIPIEKAILFRTTAIYDNPEGRSILRRAYVSWVRKKAVEEAEGRAALRAAGLVVMRIPGTLMETGAGGEEQDAYTAWKSLATALASDRQGGIVVPSDVHPESKHRLYDVEYIVADSRRSPDMSPIIDRIDKRIATTVMADFLLLGQQAVGSFALSSDKTALFANALEGHVRAIATAINHQLIKRMWQFNKLDEKTMPKLVSGDIITPNLGELSTYLTALAGLGMPLFPDENLESYLREAGRLPEASEESAEERKLMAAQGSLDDPDEAAEKGMKGRKAEPEDEEDEDDEDDE